MLHQYTTKQFSYSYKQFVADASELGGLHLDRLYNDACDVGLILVSEKTLKETKWFLQEECKNADGDITHWKLLPVSESVRKNPGLDGATMLIFND